MKSSPDKPSQSARSDRSASLWAIAGTAAYHGVALLALLLVVMSFNRSRDEVLDELARREAEEREDDRPLLLAGQYVTIGDNLTSPQAMTPAETALPTRKVTPSDASNSLLATTAPSEAKTTPRRDEAAEAEARRRAAEQQRKAEQERSAQQIGERVQFGNPGEGTPADSRQGATDGTATQGATSGRPGANVKGRTLASWSLPHGSASGTIVVSVRVDRQGRVIAATFAGGSGRVASDASARAACIAAAKRSAFSVATDGPAEQVGTITYKFVAPGATK